MDSGPQVVANAKRKTSSGMNRPMKPKKLVKGSAATKRWMAYVRSKKKGGRKSAKTPARKPTSRKSGKASSPKPGSREEYKKMSMTKLNQLIREGDKMAKDVRSRKLGVMTRKRNKTLRKKGRNK